MGVVRTLRTTYGFGVHSPFAFEMITSVLRGKNNYYALTAMMQRSNRRDCSVISDFGRLLFQLAMYFAPHEISVYGTPPYVATALVDSARVELGTQCENSDMLVYYGRAADAVGWKNFLQALQSQSTFIALIYFEDASALGKELLAKLIVDTHQGMTFLSGSRKMVIAGLQNLPRQDYKLLF